MIKIIIKMFIILLILLSIHSNLSRMYRNESVVIYTSFEYGINLVLQTLMVIGVMIL